MTTAAEHTESKILALVSKRSGLTLEDIPANLPNSTWNQVFASVDKLSRQGAISLRRRGRVYELWAHSPSEPANGSQQRSTSQYDSSKSPLQPL